MSRYHRYNPRMEPFPGVEECRQLLGDKHFCTELTSRELEAASLETFLLLKAGFMLTDGDEGRPAEQLQDTFESFLNGGEITLEGLRIVDFEYQHALSEAQIEELVARRKLQRQLAKDGRESIPTSDTGFVDELMHGYNPKIIEESLKKSGVTAKPTPSPEHIEEQTAEIEGFRRRFLAELLRRQWKALTEQVSAVRYESRDGGPEPVAFRNPDGSWFASDEGPGCEAKTTFTLAHWRSFFRSPPAGLVEWDEIETNAAGDGVAWTLLLRSEIDTTRPSQLLQSESAQELSDSQLSRALTKARNGVLFIPFLFSDSESEPWEAGAFALLYSPPFRTKQLLAAEQLRRKVKPHAPKGAVYAAWFGDFAGHTMQFDGFWKPDPGADGGQILRIENTDDLKRDLVREQWKSFNKDYYAKNEYVPADWCRRTGPYSLLWDYDFDGGTSIIGDNDQYLRCYLKL